MRSILSLFLGLALLASAACTCTSAPVAPGKSGGILINVNREGLALEGYDPVAYHTDNAAVLGKPEHQSKYMGAWYRFVSAEHKAAFEASPEKFAPAYGGYCGYAVSINRLSPVDPKLFQVLDGRLVLQHNKTAWERWNADVSGNLVKADGYWPGLLEKNGRGEKRLVNTDRAGLALEGHDPVAYFTLGRPTKGLAQHEAVYEGARYWFASPQNRETFERDPAHYAPAFGGYCGYAASIDKVSPVNVEIFQIIEDRLVLQHTPKAYALFNKDAPANLAQADANWPGLVACKGR